MDFTVKEFIEPETLQDDLKLSNENINEAMTKQAGLYSHYGTLAAQAQEQEDRFEYVIDLLNAKLDQKIRNDLAGAKTTENQIKSLIMLEPEMIRATKAYHQAKSVASVAKAALESLKQRRDMLVQLAVNDREDRKGELRLHGGAEPSGRAQHVPSYERPTFSRAG